MKKYFATVFFLFLIQFCFAQDFEGYYTASFDFNTPLSTPALINTTSLFGFKLGYHRLLNAKFSLGGELNWGTYKQYKPTTTITQSNRSLTTDYFNYVYNYNLALSGRYYTSYNHKYNPFFGMGLGATYNKYTAFYNVYTHEQKAGGILFRPEMGMIIRFSQRKAVSGLIGVHYDYSTAHLTEAFTRKHYSGLSNFGFNLGIVILDW